MKNELETEEEANYPTFNLNTCNLKYLQLLGDSIFGAFAYSESSFEANIDTIEYEPFKNDFVNTCEFLQLNTSSAELPYNGISIFQIQFKKI